MAWGEDTRPDPFPPPTGQLCLVSHSSSPSRPPHLGVVAVAGELEYVVKVGEPREQPAQAPERAAANVGACAGRGGASGGGRAGAEELVARAAVLEMRSCCS